MCFCESDAVKILIHVKARKRYPGIRFHEPSLASVAAAHDLRSTLELQAMDAAALDRLSAELLARLPDSHCPPRHAVSVA